MGQKQQRRKSQPSLAQKQSKFSPFIRKYLVSISKMPLGHNPAPFTYTAPSLSHFSRAERAERARVQMMFGLLMHLKKIECDTIKLLAWHYH